MERYPKLFILASIGYLLAGVLLGIHLGSSGSADPFISRFVHVHLNLLGFMAMFIYGVAYHILPRFNAKPVKKPVLIRVHFYLVNAGLLGMCGFALADGLYGAGFIFFSLVEASGIALFAYNLLPIMAIEKAEEEEEEEPEEENDSPAVSSDMKVPEVLDKWPGLTDIFVEFGFRSLTNQAARETYARNVIISQACKLHKVNETEFLEKLNAAVKSGAAGVAPVKKEAKPEQKAAATMAKGKKISRGEVAESETLIGSLIEVYPETKTVFEKHYGEGCFSCPGQAFETLEQTAVMHGMKTEKILGEVNSIIESVKV